MVDWCIINSGLVKAGCIPDYVIYGIILFVIGLLLAIFIPFETGKKIGFTMVVAGIVMAIFFPLVVGWWTDYPNFRYSIYGILAFVFILFVLFYKRSPVRKK